MVEPTGHCPYLGLKQNQAIRFASPTAEHRCYAAGQAQEIPSFEPNYQTAYCLSPNHTRCPLYTGSGLPSTPPPPVPLPPQARLEPALAPASGLRGWFSGLAPRDRAIYGLLVGLLGLILLFYAAAGFNLLRDGFSFDAPPPAPTAAPTGDPGGLPAAPSPSPEPPTATATPQPTATPSATARPTRTPRPTPSATRTEAPSPTAAGTPTPAPPTATATLVYIPPPPPPPTNTPSDLIPLPTDTAAPPPEASATSEPAPTSVEPAPTSVEPAPTSVEPAPTSVEPAPTSAEPAPTVAQEPTADLASTPTAPPEPQRTGIVP